MIKYENSTLKIYIRNISKIITVNIPKIKFYILLGVEKKIGRSLQSIKHGLGSRRNYNIFVHLLTVIQFVVTSSLLRTTSPCKLTPVLLLNTKLLSVTQLYKM